MSVVSYIFGGSAAVGVLIAAAWRWPERWPDDAGALPWAAVALLWPILAPAVLIRMATTKHH